MMALLLQQKQAANLQMVAQSNEDLLTILKNDLMLDLEDDTL